ncbi:nuclear transport factor 2 family protein [Nocardioides sp. WS12]|uniref:nuclear transport factor 2 family protein n=1 Tax=Nocardioides sp. WS12 TaxID=2486272 RepID=UPI0015F94BC9|nr:nuclear transport factor 2 family protein [Nocardioides sp. WS12]
MDDGTTGTVALVDGFVEAYNSGDLERISSVLGDDVELTHHNRGETLKGRAAVMGMFEMAGQIMPGKSFVDRHSIDVLGPDKAVVRHTWTATSVADIPGMAVQGETIRLDLATFLTFADGLVVEYHDFG